MFLITTNLFSISTTYKMFTNGQKQHYDKLNKGAPKSIHVITLIPYGDYITLDGKRSSTDVIRDLKERRTPQIVWAGLI